MGNVQRVLETTFCEAPGCPDDAAPDARFCTRHMRARVVHLDCSYWRCDLRAEPDSIFCEAHGLLEAARAQPVITPSSSIGGPTLDAGDVIPSETKEPDVSPDPSVDEPRERPQCRIEGCENLAETWTIGNRRQGGRYDMCSVHLEELTERTRETRRRNREAAGLPESDAARARRIADPTAAELEEPAASAPPVERPPVETIARGSRIRAEHSARARELPVIPCPRVDQHPAHAWETAEEGSPEAWCRGLNTDGTEPYDPMHPSRERWAPGVGALPLLEQEPQPGDVELPVELDLPPAKRCGGFNPILQAQRWPRPEEIPEPLRPRTAAAREPGPERAPTWAARAAALADVGKAIDDLEFELDQARAHWRALASPE